MSMSTKDAIDKLNEMLQKEARNKPEEARTKLQSTSAAKESTSSSVDAHNICLKNALERLQEFQDEARKSK